MTCGREWLVPILPKPPPIQEFRDDNVLFEPKLCGVERLTVHCELAARHQGNCVAVIEKDGESQVIEFPGRNR